jgi:hypothetical protein
LDNIQGYDAGEVFIVIDTEDEDFDLYAHAEGSRSDTHYIHRAIVEKIVEPLVGPLTLRQVNATLDEIEDGLTYLTNILKTGRTFVNFNSEK